jgi:integrase
VLRRISESRLQVLVGQVVNLRTSHIMPILLRSLKLSRSTIVGAPSTAGFGPSIPWHSAQLPDLAHPIRREDVPRAPQRLPRALTAQQDRLIQQELLRRDDLPANVFLLLRHTGMRIGECAGLSRDCLHNAGPDR